MTTIAGGYSQKPGKMDGPAQNATFSNEFELVFIPDRCALMICDYGNKLVRQINLRKDDCSHGSQSGKVGTNYMKFLLNTMLHFLWKCSGRFLSGCTFLSAEYISATVFLFTSIML